MGVNPLANRKNANPPANGNSGVRYQDSTAKVSGIINSGRPLQQTGRKERCNNCSS